MTINIDGNPITLFQGAQLKDALLKISKDTLSAVKKGQKNVWDEWGNRMGLEGQLMDSQSLFIKPAQERIKF
jgi:hypothetical protein